MILGKIEEDGIPGGDGDKKFRGETAEKKHPQALSSSERFPTDPEHEQGEGDQDLDKKNDGPELGWRSGYALNGKRAGSIVFVHKVQWGKQDILVS